MQRDIKAIDRKCFRLVRPEHVDVTGGFEPLGDLTFGVVVKGYRASIEIKLAGNLIVPICQFANLAGQFI